MPRIRSGREEENEDTEGQGRRLPHEEVEEDKGEGEDSEGQGFRFPREEEKKEEDQDATA